MNIATLRKKARDGSLEVEHLLRAAIEKPQGLAEELSRLAVVHGWKDESIQPDETRVVPFAKWAVVAATYANEGFIGLRALAQKPENIEFVLGLVEEIHTNESVSLAIDVCEKYLADLPQFEGIAFRLASSFNLLLSFKHAPPVTAVQASTIQKFLFSLYPYANSEAERALVLLALRGVGDRDAIQFVDSAKAFSEPWSSTKESVLRALRKRVRANSLTQPTTT